MQNHPKLHLQLAQIIRTLSPYIYPEVLETYCHYMSNCKSTLYYRLTWDLAQVMAFISVNTVNLKL